MNPSNFAIMNIAYQNITPQRGWNRGGICIIQIADIDWLVNDVEIDFNTNNVTTPLQVSADENFLDLRLLEQSYDYTETPNTDKPGSYMAIALTGTLDYIDERLQKQLNDFRYKQLVMIVHDMRGQRKLIGNKTAGMIMSFTNENKTDNAGGLQTLTLNFSGNFPDSPPFYTA